MHLDPFARYKGKPTIFFRNDDADVFYLGDKRDILYRLTDIFLNKNVPLIHAVVPSTITDKTINYFIKSSSQNDILEFIQHGWAHTKYKMGEFDIIRNYEQQKNDINRGRKILLDIFGKSFFHAFTAPYGAYTHNTIDILSKESFTALSSGVSFSPKRIYFDKLGRFFNQPFLFGKRISFHGKTICNYKIVEFSTSINIIRKMNPLEILSKNEILNKINLASKFTNEIGILLHHITLNQNDCGMISSLIDELKFRGFLFSNLSSLCKRITT